VGYQFLCAAGRSIQEQTLGTNKRYADSYDRRALAREAAARTQTHAAPHVAVRDWQPPWPPIMISDCEWIIMRDEKTKPAGIIRRVKLGPRDENFYRVVTWAPTSENRALVGYFTTLQEADRAILFRPPQHDTASSHPAPVTQRRADPA
jgi:hypothetical protein